ncbi:MAG: ATPase, T2SS/T4P/T4SS family [Geobacteraceae bacterium]|nr:ATPase, T2SS/T4P/T4SS family [Geobacteraceae bacterium]
MQNAPPSRQTGPDIPQATTAAGVTNGAGMLASLLLEKEEITKEQLSYAIRVNKKMATPQTLLQTLIELGYTSADKVKQALCSSSLNIRLGDLLVELGYLKESDLRQALGMQKEIEGKKRLGEILVEGGFIEERRLLETLSYQVGFPVISTNFAKLDKSLFNVIPTDICEEYDILPISKEGNVVTVAFADPLDRNAFIAAERFFGSNISPAIISRSSIKEALAARQRSIEPAAAVSDENTIIGIINNLLDDAIQENASDIHMEPMHDRLRVRFRRDGVMQHHKDFLKALAPQLSSRIKIMGQADIAEKRRHQDARILYASRIHGVNIDLRVSFFITIYGENIVIRLLSSKTSLLNLKEIGMAPRMLESFIYNAVDTPTGVMIITGPTGSGKTNTLYSCVDYINDIHTSIITAEDPVEIVIDGICQCSINPKIGVTFEETLRHIVRQDPDVIVLGEVRDKFSAEIAFEAALTGHKVLTTFHTEDSIGALLRLLTMQIESFLIASTITCVVAQRLLRRVCTSCAEPYQPTPLDLSRLYVTSSDIAGANFMRGRGCKACGHSGYKGRIGVFELLMMNEVLRNAILENKNSLEIRRLSIESAGLVSLFEDGLVKAAQGLVSVQEIITDLPKRGKPRPISELRRILGAA